jgi:hypothetical protein
MTNKPSYNKQRKTKLLMNEFIKSKGLEDEWKQFRNIKNSKYIVEISDCVHYFNSFNDAIDFIEFENDFISFMPSQKFKKRNFRIRKKKKDIEKNI